ncbi:2-C-methyl-D-erythritol 4-phosphate cytidylyltransferase [Marinicrinis lubricantis]|uniref:2-C-methyl-D-erythritol 4-phosphate cytidylyltransferase n=1 Tax=Marinicrinis lubricantis TaxID=2086470 RepID=A0ABW1IS24_9BACL
MKIGLGAVIVAAGKGTRMNTPESKQYLLLEDKPILVHTIQAFERFALIEHITVVVGSEHIERVQNWTSRYEFKKQVKVVAGGKDRQESVYEGLKQLPENIEWVLIHDGVRPFILQEQMQACWEAAQITGSAVLAVPVKDTIKTVGSDMRIKNTPDRQSLWAVQTPQAFRVSEIADAHRRAASEGYVGTDDASLMERMGRPVQVVMGDYRNIKITTPEDLRIASVILEEIRTAQS